MFGYELNTEASNEFVQAWVPSYDPSSMLRGESSFIACTNMAKAKEVLDKRNPAPDGCINVAVYGTAIHVAKIPGVCAASSSYGISDEGFEKLRNLVRIHNKVVIVGSNFSETLSHNESSQHYWITRYGEYQNSSLEISFRDGYYIVQWNTKAAKLRVKRAKAVGVARKRREELRKEKEKIERSVTQWYYAVCNVKHDLWSSCTVLGGIMRRHFFDNREITVCTFGGKRGERKLDYLTHFFRVVELFERLEPARKGFWHMLKSVKKCFGMFGVVSQYLNTPKYDKDYKYPKEYATSLKRFALLVKQHSSKKGGQKVKSKPKKVSS